MSLVANVFNVPGIVTFPINTSTFAAANLVMVAFVLVIIVLWRPLASLWQVMAGSLVSPEQRGSVAATKLENQVNEVEGLGVRRLASLRRQDERIEEDDLERAFNRYNGQLTPDN